MKMAVEDTATVEAEDIWFVFSGINQPMKAEELAPFRLLICFTKRLSSECL